MNSFGWFDFGSGITLFRLTGIIIARNKVAGSKSSIKFIIIKELLYLLCHKCQRKMKNYKCKEKKHNVIF